MKGSATARGTFNDRGVFVADDGSTPDSLNTLFFYSPGWAMAHRFENLGSTADFNGKPAAAFNSIIAKTRNGKSFAEVSNKFAVGAYTGTLYNFPVNFSLPTILADGTKVGAGEGFIGMLMDGQYVFANTIDDLTTSASLINFPTLDYQIAFAFRMDVLAPEKRLGVGKYKRPTYPQSYGTPLPAHPIDVSATPLMKVCFSDNVGFSWTEASSLSAYEESDSVMEMVVGDLDETRGGGGNQRWG